jgi:hypothetical protein
MTVKRGDRGKRASDEDDEPEYPPTACNRKNLRLSTIEGSFVQ